MTTTSRHRLEFAAIIAVGFLAGVIFAHTTGTFRKTFDALFDLWIVGFGAAMIFYPQWFYQTATPEQAEQARRRLKIRGIILLAAGVIFCCLRLFWI